MDQASAWAMTASLAIIPVGLQEMLARFPHFEVDPDEVAYVQTNAVRGPATCVLKPTSS